MLTAYNLSFERHRNKNKAYAQANETLERLCSNFRVSNYLIRKGLEAELFYYNLCRSKNSLIPASASGSHVDFVGLVHGRPAAIDVTTNPKYKENDVYEKLSEYQKQKYQYFVALVSLRDHQVTHYPLLLPRVKDGGLGHFILVMLYPLIEEFRLSCVDQFLIRYNPRAETDEKSVEVVLKRFDYLVDYPPDAVNIYPKGSLATRMNTSASFFEKVSNCVLSAVVALGYHPGTISPGMSTISYWIHPHSYIRDICGSPFSLMRHNVGAVLDRKFRTSREREAKEHFEWRRESFPIYKKLEMTRRS